MLDQLIDLVRQHAGGALDNLPGVEPAQQAQVPQAAGSSILEALQQHAGSGGGLSMLQGMLQGGGGATSGMASSLAGPAAQILASKLGISPAIASTAIAAILPKVLSSMAQKTQDPNDSSFSMDGIMSALGGGQSGGGLAGLAGSLFK